MNYNELIKALRCTENDKDCDPERLMRDAADAIEELSKKRVGTWHRIKGTKKLTSLFATPVEKCTRI